MAAWRYNISLLVRASDRSERKKVKFRGIFRDKFAEQSADFVGNFRANFAKKQSLKKRQFCGYVFSRQNFTGNRSVLR